MREGCLGPRRPDTGLYSARAPSRPRTFDPSRSLLGARVTSRPVGSAFKYASLGVCVLDILEPVGHLFCTGHVQLVNSH